MSVPRQPTRAEVIAEIEEMIDAVTAILEVRHDPGLAHRRRCLRIARQAVDSYMASPLRRRKVAR